MDRQTILQALMSQKKLKNYLEIGVFNGHIFFRIPSTFKVAVDPEFQFDTMRKIGKTLLNPYNLYNQYFEKTSDAFFEQDAPRVFANNKVELSLIDGMHEYAYALRDIENTLRYMEPHGVIVIHDCNPLTKAAACSFAEWKARNFTDTWNGDVWKAILYLRSQRDDINAFVLDTDHGLGIVTYGKPEKKMSFTPEQIDRLTYEDFNKNRADYLNLKPAEYFYAHFGVTR